ncbi:tyrosine-type recombinase/integrase [Roseospira marina]|uniref:Tyrosine-type recombinase/integrase n=1 Tax=Roseospira marina TaxID=140057 RepID=A0A5M6I770_9PROT|nr:tyrosine-type recombinase/integrase [Roseospira marina]KAA5604046.1 tyrosine-type recombinase/integrase [Roseospira marina]MBB5089020.1 integrase [Roseospira marina]
MPVYRIKGIKRVRNPRTGAYYLYHRGTGKRLREKEGTAAFLEEVAALDRNAEDRQSDPKAPAGTWGWLRELYLASPKYAQLAPRTRKSYRAVLDYLAEPNPERPGKGMDPVPLDRIDSPSVMRLRDATHDRHGWRQANLVLAVISLVWNWGRPYGYVTGSNPAEKVPRIKRPRDKPAANRPWTDDELASVLATAQTGVREAVALGAYTGLRQGDVLALPWSAIEDGWLRCRQSKTGEEVWIPVHRDLAAILEQAERRATVIVAGARDRRPYSGDGFRTLFFRLIRKLEAEGRIGQGLTFHGLRHGLATRLADAGADDRTIAAITGHKQVSMVQRYTRTADKRRRARAGMDLLEGGKPEDKP